jgi:hypothetical protein
MGFFCAKAERERRRMRLNFVIDRNCSSGGRGLQAKQRYHYVTSMGLTVLYRPVGKREYELIEATGFRRFPPRLPEQPFFYPVTNEEYATQIARDWNTRDEASGWTGYVLQFRIPSAFLGKYPVRTVGSAIHQEYWIPAGELEDFNDQIEGAIEAVARFGSEAWHRE